MAKSSEFNAVEHALYYASKGLRVVPIVPRSKRPVISIHKIIAEPLSENEIRRAFRRHGEDKPASIGFITGLADNWSVLDVETVEGKETLKVLHERGCHMSPTLRVKTPNGMHYYFHSSTPVPSRAIGPGIKLIGERSYVPLPPSLHFTDKIYEWAGEETEPAPIPQWLLEMANKTNKITAV